MYYPLQIPYLLNQAQSEAFYYTEEPISPLFSAFVICFWEMSPRTQERKKVEHVMIADGCIDLVADFEGGKIGFAGVSRTNFCSESVLPFWSMGARLKPGAFYQLAGVSAMAAMDTFLPLEAVDDSFDSEYYFSLPFAEAKGYLRDFITKLSMGKSPDMFTSLFDDLFDIQGTHIPVTVMDLYQRLNFSPRQCQRLFARHFGLTPQMVLSILRFQQCLLALTWGEMMPNDLLKVASYYDQPHFIRDFKRHIGMTPPELVRMYLS
ncbi:MAG: AraC family transcriptional regulator [Peptococcaceae bacterium]|nr:AraC family transcriptional regulator [Peptococcaceae bacterium]